MMLAMDTIYEDEALQEVQAELQAEPAVAAPAVPSTSPPRLSSCANGNIRWMAPWMPPSWTSPPPLWTPVWGFQNEAAWWWPPQWWCASLGPCAITAYALYAGYDVPLGSSGPAVLPVPYIASISYLPVPVPVLQPVEQHHPVQVEAEAPIELGIEAPMHKTPVPYCKQPPHKLHLHQPSCVHVTRTWKGQIPYSSSSSVKAGCLNYSFDVGGIHHGSFLRTKRHSTAGKRCKWMPEPGGTWKQKFEFQKKTFQKDAWIGEEQPGESPCHLGTLLWNIPRAQSLPKGLARAIVTANGPQPPPPNQCNICNSN